MFPDPGYLHSEDGLVWLWHLLVNLYVIYYIYNKSVLQFIIYIYIYIYIIYIIKVALRDIANVEKSQIFVLLENEASYEECFCPQVF